MRTHLQNTSDGAFSGLLEVRQPIYNLADKLTYLKMDQSEETFKIIGDVPLSQVFADLNAMKDRGDVKDFSYYEPSLHHAFVAISNSSSNE